MTYMGHAPSGCGGGGWLAKAASWSAMARPKAGRAVLTVAADGTFEGRGTVLMLARPDGTPDPVYGAHWLNEAANVWQALGDAPELLTKASSKVAEAVLAASMARSEAPAGKPIDSSARATERFISDAEELLERARQNLARLEQP